MTDQDILDMAKEAGAVDPEQVPHLLKFLKQFASHVAYKAKQEMLLADVDELYYMVKDVLENTSNEQLIAQIRRVDDNN